MDRKVLVNVVCIIVEKEGGVGGGGDIEEAEGEVKI